MTEKGVHVKGEKGTVENDSYGAAEYDPAVLRGRDQMRDGGTKVDAVQWSLGLRLKRGQPDDVARGDHTTGVKGGRTLQSNGLNFALSKGKKKQKKSRRL